MASRRKNASAGTPPGPATKRAGAKKVAAKKVVANEAPASPETTVHSDWLVTLGSMTLQQLVQVGIIERETNKQVPPESLRMVLSDGDITRIVDALAARLTPQNT
jgi:hypothetical protein